MGALRSPEWKDALLQEEKDALRLPELSRIKRDWKTLVTLYKYFVKCSVWWQ